MKCMHITSAMIDILYNVTRKVGNSIFEIIITSTIYDILIKIHLGLITFQKFYFILFSNKYLVNLVTVYEATTFINHIISRQFSFESSPFLIS